MTHTEIAKLPVAPRSLFLIYGLMNMENMLQWSRIMLQITVFVFLITQLLSPTWRVAVSFSSIFHHILSDSRRYKIYIFFIIINIYYEDCKNYKLNNICNYINYYKIYNLNINDYKDICHLLSIHLRIPFLLINFQVWYNPKCRIFNVFIRVHKIVKFKWNKIVNNI